MRIQWILCVIVDSYLKNYLSCSRNYRITYDVANDDAFVLCIHEEKFIQQDEKV